MRKCVRVSIIFFLVSDFSECWARLDSKNAIIFSFSVHSNKVLAVHYQTKEPRYGCNSPLRCDPRMIKVHLRTLEVQNNSMGFRTFFFFFLHKKRTWVRVIEVNEGRKNKRARSKRHHREWGSKEKFLIHFLPTAPLIHSPSLSAESSPNPAVSFQGKGWLTHTDMESSNIRYISSTDCITAQNILVPSCLHPSFLPGVMLQDLVLTWVQGFF